MDLLILGETPLNAVFATSAFLAWFDGVLSGTAALEGCDFERYEEVERFYREWMLNKDAGNVKRLMPTAAGLWRVNLPQSRLFGWFPERGALILDTGCLIEQVKGTNAVGYPHFIDIVENDRAASGSPWILGDIRHVRNY